MVTIFPSVLSSSYRSMRQMVPDESGQPSLAPLSHSDTVAVIPSDGRFTPKAMFVARYDVP
jgi:hypothetical protein